MNGLFAALRRLCLSRVRIPSLRLFSALLQLFVCGTLHRFAFAAETASPEGPAFVIREAVQIPKTVYVGDPVTLLVNCEAPEELAPGLSAADLPVPEDILGALTFDGLELSQEGDIVRIAFLLRAWKPGLISLGALRLAGIPLPGFTVEVSSVLDASDTDRAPAGPLSGLLPPGTKLIIAVFIGLVPLILLCMLVIRRSVLPALRRVMLRRPRRRLLSRMKRLVQSQRALPPSELLSRQVVILRAWLSLLSGRPLYSCTPRELKRLEEIDPVLFASGLRCPHELLLAFHDRSRFSGRRPDWALLDDLLPASLAACEAADLLLSDRERGGCA